MMADRWEDEPSPADIKEEFERRKKQTGGCKRPVPSAFAGDLLWCLMMIAGPVIFCLVVYLWMTGAI
jgi:hypothetical protein